MTKIYQDNIGVVFNVATGVTLTGSSVTQLKIKKPSGAVTVWGAAIDGTNTQQLNYTTASKDLNEAGTYFIQTYIVQGSQQLLGETAKIYVYGPFE
jgi:hypothetical protein